MLMILPYGLPTSNQNEQQRFNYNVLTHDVMGKVVPRGGVRSLL